MHPAIDVSKTALGASTRIIIVPRFPGESCGVGICNPICECGVPATGEVYGVFRSGLWYGDTTETKKWI